MRYESFVLIANLNKPEQKNMIKFCFVIKDTQRSIIGAMVFAQDLMVGLATDKRSSPA